jgi:hypothetical protein
MTASTKFADAAVATVATFDLDATIDTLGIIADWREDLQRRIRRARLTFLYADCGIDTSALQTEAETFGRVCRCLSWRTSI